MTKLLSKNDLHLQVTSCLNSDIYGNFLFPDPGSIQDHAVHLVVLSL